MSIIKLFETKQVRSLWDAEREAWFFSIVDVALTPAIVDAMQQEGRLSVDDFNWCRYAILKAQRGVANETFSSRN